jgi:rod shape-determining protein MreD
MISTVIRWIGAIVGIYILQTTIVPVIAIAGIKPDILLVALFFLAYKHDVIPAVVAGFLIGLAKDFYAPEILGHNALATSLAGFFAGLFNEKVMRIDPIFQLLMFALMFLIHDCAIYAVQIAKAQMELRTLGTELLFSTLPRTLYTLLFALVPIFYEYIFPRAPKR